MARLAEGVALAVLFAATLELACRIEEWLEFRTPILARERSQQDLLVRDTLGMHGRANGRFQKWSLNAQGMRGPDVAPSKPRDVIRVVTAGASETFGLYESPGLEYPRQLQDSLNARLKARGPQCDASRVEVLNAAMPGMSLPTVEQDLRLRVRPLEPDFVVLYATPPTYLYDNVPVAALRELSTGVQRELPFRHALFPRMAARLRTQAKSLLPAALQDRIRRREIQRVLDRHPSDWRFNTIPADRLNAFESDMRRAVGTIRSIGAGAVIVTHANRFVGAGKVDEGALRMWEKFYPRASGRTILQFDSAARLSAISVAIDSQAVVVDLAAALAPHSTTAFADYSHFTDFGAAVTAGNVARAIAASTELASQGECEKAPVVNLQHTAAAFPQPRCNSTACRRFGGVNSISPAAH